MKFMVRAKREKPRKKKLHRPRFVHNETYMVLPRRELGTPAVEYETLTDWATVPASNIISRLEMFVQRTVKFTQNLQCYRRRRGHCVT